EPEPHRADLLAMPIFELNSGEEFSSELEEQEQTRETPLKPQDRWTAVLAAIAVVIAGLIVGLMICRVGGWGGTPTRRAAAAPATVKSDTQVPSPALAETPSPVPHEEILEFGASPAEAPSRGVAVMAAKKQPVVPAGQPGLAIYEK